MRVVTFKIDEDLLHKADVYAMNKKISRSDVIREALEKLLDGINGNTELKVEKVPIILRQNYDEVMQDGKNLAKYTLRINKDIWAKLDELSKRTKRTKRDLLTEAIIKYLKEQGMI